MCPRNPSRRARASRAWRRVAFASLVALGSLACERDEQPPTHGEPAAPGEPAPASPSAALRSEAPLASPPARTRPRLALWVPCEGSQRALEHPARLEALLADAVALGASDLFVQVYRGGRAFFDSTRADVAPFTSMRQAFGGEDPLARLIAAAQARGIRVHAWVNVFSLADRRDAAILRALGSDAVQVDRRGRSVLDYPALQLPEPDATFLRMGTPAVWLDPAAPGVAEWLAATLAELPARYPALAGLHLDYARHPDVLPFSPGARFGVGLDFGYGAATRARFRSETGNEAPLADELRHGAAFDQWRRDTTTRAVRAIADAARLARPGLLVSAAVWAYPERSYLSLFQDWPGWLDDGVVDFAVPMLYTRDERLFGLELRAYRGIDAARLWVGLGSWLFTDAPERAASQLARARDSGLAGVSLFSWDALAESPALRDALVAEATRGD